MEQKEQTKCMGSDGMQKMNGVINADLMTVEEIHQKLFQNFAGGMEKINVKGGRRCRLSSRYQKKYCMIQSKR